MNRYRNCHHRPRRRKRRTTNTSRHVLVFSKVMLRSIILLLVRLHLCLSFHTAIAIATLTTTTAIATTAVETPVEEGVVAQQQQVIALVDKEESAASAVAVPSSDAGHIDYAYVPFPLWIIGIEVTLLIVSLLLCVGCWIFVYIFRNKMIVAIGQP